MMRTGIRNIDQYHSFYPRKEKPNHTSYNLGFLFMNSTNFLPSNPKSLQDAAICPRIYKAGQTMLDLYTYKSIPTRNEMSNYDNYSTGLAKFLIKH